MQVHSQVICQLEIYGLRFHHNKGGIRPLNPRITYDGIYWNLSLSYEKESVNNDLNQISIGIDLGLKTFASIVVTDNTNNKEIERYSIKSNKEKFKKLSKRKRRLDRRISKQLEKYKKSKKKGEVIKKSNNYFKLLKKRQILTHKMTNIQKDTIHQLTAKLVKAKPENIVIEDLNVSGMMKNHKLAKWVQFNQFYNFKVILKYKCELNGINLIIADRYFPSSKMCPCCGVIKPKLSLSERIFICEECGHTEDRDYNAAYNLSCYR